MSDTVNQVSLNVDDLKHFLGHIIENNRYLQENKKNTVSTEVVGESGIGKTSVILQIAEEHQLAAVKLNLAQIEELGDLVGFPIRQFQVAKPLTEEDKKKGGTLKLVWIDEHATETYRQHGYKFTGQKRMAYCPPEWIADKPKGGILILDDWNRADIRFIQAVMELIDRQEYISWKLPKDWHIILTSNPDNGDYLVQSIDSAQRTRFITANLKFDMDCWAKWAEDNDIDGRCINFMLMHPEVVTQQTNARSITTFFNSISSFKVFDDELPMIQMIGEGSVGPEFATLFTTFIANKLDKLVTPKDMLTKDSDEEVQRLMEECTGKLDSNDYRSDIASVLSTRLVNYSLHYSESNAVTEKITNRLVFLCTKEIFAADLNYYIIKNILNGNKQKFQKLMLNQEVVKMAVK